MLVYAMVGTLMLYTKAACLGQKVASKIDSSLFGFQVCLQVLCCCLSLVEILGATTAATVATGLEEKWMLGLQVMCARRAEGQEKEEKMKMKMMTGKGESA